MLLALSLLIGIPGYSQAPDIPSDGIYKEIAPGASVTITWTYPDEIRPKIKFFRIRKGQTAGGTYIAFATVSRDLSEFQFYPSGSCQVFVSAVWDYTDPNGIITTRETPGSNHVQIFVRK
jgi:hypothetical protein